MLTQTEKAMTEVKDILDKGSRLFYPLGIGSNDGEATATFFNGFGMFCYSADRGVLREVARNLENDSAYTVEIKVEGGCELYTLYKN